MQADQHRFDFQRQRTERTNMEIHHVRGHMF